MAAPRKLDLEATSKSITGWDENAVVEKFGVAVPDITHRSTELRVAVFIDLMHDGMDKDAAYNQAMNLTLADLNDMVEAGEADADPLEPTPAP